jgi:hypothetical protein
VVYEILCIASLFYWCYWPPIVGTINIYAQEEGEALLTNITHDIFVRDSDKLELELFQHDGFSTTTSYYEVNDEDMDVDEEIDAKKNLSPQEQTNEDSIPPKDVISNAESGLVITHEIVSSSAALNDSFQSVESNETSEESYGETWTESFSPRQDEIETISANSIQIEIVGNSINTVNERETETIDALSKSTDQEANMNLKDEIKSETIEVNGAILSAPTEFDTSLLDPNTIVEEPNSLPDTVQSELPAVSSADTIPTDHAEIANDT